MYKLHSAVHLKIYQFKCTESFRNFGLEKKNDPKEGGQIGGRSKEESRKVNKEKTKQRKINWMKK